MGRLVINADDYGYAPSYEAGIIAAARAGALDGVSAMALRAPDPPPLLECGVEVGLHLELASDDPEPARQAERQVELFRELFERLPTHIDGHHHCHARPGPTALAIARLGRRLGVPVRSVDARHRRLLRCLGVRTADRLIGRMGESEPVLPPELASWLRGGPPRGTTEWVVHPGHGGGGSSYDRGREEDLALLLELGDRDAWARRGIRRIGPAAL